MKAAKRRHRPPVTEGEMRSFALKQRQRTLAASRPAFLKWVKRHRLPGYL